MRGGSPKTGPKPLRASLDSGRVLHTLSRTRNSWRRCVVWWCSSDGRPPGRPPRGVQLRVDVVVVDKGSVITSASRERAGGRINLPASQARRQHDAILLSGLVNEPSVVHRKLPPSSWSCCPRPPPVRSLRRASQSNGGKRPRRCERTRGVAASSLTGLKARGGGYIARPTRALNLDGGAARLSANRSRRRAADVAGRIRRLLGWKKKDVLLRFHINGTCVCVYKFALQALGSPSCKQGNNVLAVLPVLM